jgi:hypothetical protein
MSYKRFFAFGCSFTDWPWTTWADIIAAAYPGAQYYNFGKGGGSNQLILSRVMEADSVFNFNKDDLVIVQWTSITRESRYIVDRWRGSGNVYNDNESYGEDFYKYIDPLDYLIRDCAAIKAVHTLLEHKQCKFEFLSMVPIVKPESLARRAMNIDLGSTSNAQYLLKTYNTVLSRIKPSYLETIFNGKFWPNPTKLTYSDGHPDPEQHLQYIERVLPEVPVTDSIRALIQKDMKALINLPRIVEDNQPGKASQSWHLNVNTLWVKNRFCTVGNTVFRNDKGLRF